MFEMLLQISPKNAEKLLDFAISCSIVVHFCKSCSKGAFLYNHNYYNWGPGAPLTYFNDGEGGGGVRVLIFAV